MAYVRMFDWVDAKLMVDRRKGVHNRSNRMVVGFKGELLVAFVISILLIATKIMLVDIGQKIKRFIGLLMLEKVLHQHRSLEQLLHWRSRK